MTTLQASAQVRPARPVNPDTGDLMPVMTIVTDDGGTFRFEAFLALHPGLAHVPTRVKSSGQNGSRERGIGTLKYERLYIDEIADAIMLAKRAENNTESSTTRSGRTKRSRGNRPKACTWAWPTRPSPTSNKIKSCQLLDVGQAMPRATSRSATARSTVSRATMPVGPAARRRHAKGRAGAPSRTTPTSPLR